MSVIEKTYLQLAEFKRIAEMRLKMEKSSGVESKLSHHIRDLIGDPATGQLGTFHSVQNEFDFKCRSIRRLYASVDQNNNLVRDSCGGYMYTAENETACDRALLDLNMQYVSISPSYCPPDQLPKDLLQIEIQRYKGLVIE